MFRDRFREQVFDNRKTGHHVQSGKIDIEARRAARLGAVQATYQMDVGGTPSEEVIDEFVAHRLGAEVEGDQYNESDHRLAGAGPASGSACR